MAEQHYNDEIWKPIPFAPDYAVSDFGRIKRIIAARSRKARFPVGHILAARPCGKKKRYLCVGLTVDGKAKNWNVHRIVARVFLGEPPHHSYEVAHGDGNGHNNRLINLRWATPSDNASDKLAHGTHGRGTKSATCKLTPGQIFAIRNAEGSQRLLGIEYGVAQSTISKIKRGERWNWLP